jgi:hypothetical protein
MSRKGNFYPDEITGMLSATGVGLHRDKRRTREKRNRSGRAEDVKCLQQRQKKPPKAF